MKKGTRVDYSERIQRVIHYIEEHLDEPLRLKKLASLACFSEYHFHRIFAVFLGMTVQEYILSRRLVKGASLLVNSSLRVTDIALEAGFETLASFTQAFTTNFSMTPSRFRKTKANGNVDTSLLEIILNLEEKVKGRCAMRKLRSEKIAYEKRLLPDLRAVVVTSGGLHDGSFVLAAQESFGRIMSYVERNNLFDRIGCALSMVPGITLSYNNPEAMISCGFSMNGDFPLEDGIEAITIDGGSYAVFLHRGPYEFIRHTYTSAYFSCLFSGRDQIRNAPPFEVYLNSPLDAAPEDLKTELHIPLE